MARRRGGLDPDKYLSEAQTKALRQHVKNMADLARQRGSTRAVIDELVIELLLGSGLRASELCDLNIGDLPMSHGKDSIWVRDGKGKVTRTVDITEGLRDRLARFVKLHRKGAGPDEPLLVGAGGQRVIYRSIYEKIRKLGRLAGIEDLHPHTLRHTYATRLYNVEQDLRLVQDQLGHASPTTTSIYAQTNVASRRRQIEAMENGSQEKPQ